MKLDGLVLPLASLFLTAACQSVSSAEDAPEVSSAAALEGAAAAVGEGGPEAMMEAYAAAGRPGPHHEHLSVFVGDWDARMTAWGPSGEVMKAEGAMTSAFDLDGRFLRQSFRGDLWGTPFEGRGYMGFNNVSGRYEAAWMASTGSNLAFSSGTCAGDGATFTLFSTETDPLTRRIADVRDVIEVHDADRHTFTRYYVVPGGEDVKGFEIVYERKD